MAITFVAAGTKGEGSAGVTPGLPAGWQENDIFILHIEGLGEDGAADGQGDFGGTLIGTVASGTDATPARVRHTVYWKRAGASESAPTTDDAGDHTLAVLTAWRGCKLTGSPINGTPVSTADSDGDVNLSATGVTTDVDNCMIVISHANGDTESVSGWTNSNLESILEATDVNTISGTDGCIAVGYGILASAGASGTTTATISASEEEANWTFALEPEPAAESGLLLGAGIL